MKRSIKSLVLVAVLIVLLGSYALVNRMNEKAEIAEEAGTFALTQRSADELTGIAWTNDTEYHFTKDENGWTNANDAAFPTDQESLCEMADKLVSMEATRKLSDVTKTEDYGFNDDSFTVTAEWSDGESTVYILGDETPFADGYYTRIEGEEGVVYTMAASLSAMFAETAIDLAELEEIGNVETAEALSIGDGLNLVRHEGGISIDPEQHWYSADGEPMDDEAVESLIADIKALEWLGLAAVGADDEELAEYGLDDTSATVVCVSGDDGDRIDLYIGAPSEDGAYYARLPGSDMVYTMEAESVEAIIGSSEASLWNNTLFPLEYEQVQNFTCMLDGKEMSFEHTAVSEDVQDGTDAASEEIDPAKEMWNRISGIYATGRSDSEADGEALLEIGISSVDGGTMECSFYSFDVDSYLAVTDTGRSILVSADEVDKLIRALKQ